MVQGLKWRQKGFTWTLRSGPKKLEMGDEDFHGLYSSNPYFKEKGVLGLYAMCKARKDN